jgi:putative acyl-CoA dehydrogenase
MVTFDRGSAPGHATHEVLNQPPPLVDYNVFSQDAALVESVRREGAAWAEAHLQAIGAFVGSAQAMQWGFEANTITPVLHTHDRYGQRIDEVTFHPSWHRLMEKSIGWGAHALAWRESRLGAHVARAATLYLCSQMEAGHCCPVSMTSAVVPVLRTQPALASMYEPLLTSLEYDPGLRPVQQKRGILSGMAMTEKQGGSDVGANTTRAVPVGDGIYLLTGHKWFCSAPMCDMFLVLARAPGGPSCFLLPRVLPDGTRNRFLIQRLKDKLGNRSNASSEVEFDEAWALLVGEEGRGVHTIIEMVNYTRLSRLAGDWGHAFGTLPPGVNVTAILERARPQM